MGLTKREGVKEIKGAAINGHRVHVRRPRPGWESVSSIVCAPTEEEFLAAMKSFREGTCNHDLRYTEDLWPYYGEYCALCDSLMEMI